MPVISIIERLNILIFHFLTVFFTERSLNISFYFAGLELSTVRVSIEKNSYPKNDPCS